MTLSALPPPSPPASPLAGCSTSGTEYLVYVGLGMAFFGQLLATMGLLLLKRASVVEADLPFYKRRLFWLGISAVVLNSAAIDAVVFALAPLALVAPVASMTVVFSNLFAGMGWLVEREYISRSSFLANVLIITGIILMTVFGPACNAVLSIPEMLEFAKRPPAFAFASAAVFVILSAVLVMRVLREGHTVRVIWLALAAALCAGLSSMGFKTVSNSVRLTISAEDTRAALGSPYPYLGMACTLVLAVSNVALLNKAVEGSPATFSIPLYQSLNVICAIVAGGLFYGEFEQLHNPVRIAGFVGGLLTSVCGIIWLANAKPPQQEPTGEPKPPLAAHPGHTVTIESIDEVRRTVGASLNASRVASQAPSRDASRDPSMLGSHSGALDEALLSGGHEEIARSTGVFDDLPAAAPVGK